MKPMTTTQTAHPGITKKMLLTGLFVLTLASAAQVHAADNGWVDLFDGKTLDGWIQKNGTASYRVEDGAIVGKTSEGSPNSFLCSTIDYGDFELEFEVKVADPA